MSHSLVAFNHLRHHAMEYNNAEYKFYKYGYFKYVKEGKAFLIEEIYVMPEFRGTPVASDIFKSFQEFMVKEKILVYYGNVFKESSKYRQRLDAFESWGMKVVYDGELYTTVLKVISPDVE